LPVAEKRVLENPAQRWAQMVLLRWQLQFDELLLAERLLDALVVLNRLRGVVLPAVHIFPTASDFRWKVVIETDLPEQYEYWLFGLRDWLGIRVDVAPARLIRALGHCIEPLGKQGVAGGVIMFPELPEQCKVTCAHVIAPGCTSIEFQAVPGDAPDVALIRGTSPCFDDSLPFVPCRPASGNETQTFLMDRSSITMRRGRRKKVGYIESRVVGFKVGDVYYKGPHCSVLPRLPKILLHLGFGRPFSQEGDSGSWVFSGDGTWIGMLVAGDEDWKRSYVAEAGPLVAFCEGEISRIKGCSPPIRSQVMGYR